MNAVWRRLGCGLAMAAGGTVVAQSIEVLPRVPAAGLSFGQAFALDVVRRWPISAEAEPFDERGLAPLALELLAESQVESGGANGPEVVATRHYRARAYTVGPLAWPAIESRVRRGGVVVISTCQPAPLQVRSGLPEPPGELEWPGDVRELPSRWPAWGIAGLAVLACAGLGFAARWLRPRAAVPTPSPVVTPASHTIALAQLEALPLPGEPAAEVLAYYTQLAQIVREHSERRFAVPADACTSQELVRRVPLGQRPLQESLEACDLVKFAAKHPAAAAHGAARQASVDYVLATAGVEVAS